MIKTEGVVFQVKTHAQAIHNKEPVTLNSQPGTLNPEPGTLTNLISTDNKFLTHH
jgi:hypothetical protein